MTDEASALAAILAALPPPVPESVPVASCASRFSLVDLHASLPLPGFDNSVMDGYALHTDDCLRPGITLTVSGEQPAGPDLGLSVSPGHAIRIFTGAPLPRNTAAVIMQEDVSASHDGRSITINDPASPGEFIRRTGADLCKGQLIASKGQLLSSAHAGVLASQGLASITCGRQPSVAIICNGSELAEPGTPLPAPGTLYNSNGPMLAALVAASRTASSIVSSLAGDDAVSLTNTIRSHLDSSDALIIAGGMSVGDHDLAKPTLAALGIPASFWRVRIKPGKPFLFGITPSGIPVFGLPGNPVSAYVTASLFVLPALRRLAGAAQPEAPKFHATAAHQLHNPGDRPHWLRGSFNPSSGKFSAAGLQESHALASLARANALVRLEPNSSLAPGDPLAVLPML
jgi:molybdopterin molybdotransferase